MCVFNRSRIIVNESMIHLGLYALVDGGFFDYPIYQGQKHCAVMPKEIEFGNQCASVRKPNENVFGRIKPRFKIMETPIRMHKKVVILFIFYLSIIFSSSFTHLLNQGEIEVIVYVCCILHNMLLKIDGLSAEKWDFDVDDYLEELKEIKSASISEMTQRLRARFCEPRKHSPSSNQAESLDSALHDASEQPEIDEESQNSYSEESSLDDSDESVSGDEEDVHQVADPDGEQSEEQGGSASGGDSTVMPAQPLLVLAEPESVEPELEPDSVIASLKPRIIMNKALLRAEHRQLYDKLVDSFHYQTEAGQVKWLRQSVDARHPSFVAAHRPQPNKY
jgi:hypothetical protein